MSDEIAPVSPKIIYVGTTLRSMTKQPTPDKVPPMAWCGILASRALQFLAVVLQEEKRLISQHQIRHIVDQIKELSVGCGALQPDSAI